MIWLYYIYNINLSMGTNERGGGGWGEVSYGMCYHYPYRVLFDFIFLLYLIIDIFRVH